MRRALTPRLGLLALGHFTIDAYSSFFSPLLPLLVVKLGLSLTLVGALVALAAVSSSFAQPLFGWLADRMHRPWFVAFGPLVAALFLSGIGLASGFWPLVALLTLGGAGVASYHPQAAVLARHAAARPSVAMSIFVTGGTLGFSLGPMFAVAVVGAFGLERTWLAALPGIVVSSLLAAWFMRERSAAPERAARPALAELGPVLRPLTLLYLCVVCRSAVSYGFMTFLPLHLAARGFAVSTGGAVLTAYLASGAVGGFFGGWLAEHWGGRRVVVTSFVAAAPLFLGFLALPDTAGLASLILGSFALQSSLPVNVVLGQELAPRHSSTVSSLLMGAAWGVGALLIGPIGALADLHGLRVALLLLALLLLAGFGCALALPDIGRVAVAHDPPAEAEPVTGH
jgi:FSR family fosmidomycin resistance protein-like MFS transporter